MKYTFLIIYVVFLMATSFAKSEGKSAVKNVKKQTNEVMLNKLKRSEKLISYDYWQGKYLIYDCKGRHFICVDEKGYDACTKKRENSYVKRRYNLGCAPLKEYKNQDKCFSAVYTIVHSIKSKKFCLNNRI